MAEAPEAPSTAALAALERLDAITRRLRRECPWDREQDERSIVPHTVEEAYELADAARRGDDAMLLDELGDVLFQVVFLALLLEERDAGSLAGVAETISAKLIRRHPHVFGKDETQSVSSEAGQAGAARRMVPGESEARELLEGADTESARGVLSNWDRIKREVEGRGEDDPFADVPENLPALLYARKVLRRADPEGGVSGERASRDADEARVGDLLLAAVALSRRLDVDPELALRAAADGVRERPGGLG
ncbi:MAG: nucleoside triphosphate pyrophosphohydrolase [Solirubrobacterales bacterium]|nr:nucleoside triphosphate pyrophosphohydrolase [Solirubrobacterales bacterium]